MFLFHVGNHRVYGGPIGNVARPGQDRRMAGELRGGLAELLGTPAGNHHLTSLLGKGQGDSQSNAGASARDQNQFVFEHISFIAHKTSPAIGGMKSSFC